MRCDGPAFTDSVRRVLLLQGREHTAKRVVTSISRESASSSAASVAAEPSAETPGSACITGGTRCQDELHSLDEVKGQPLVIAPLPLATLP